MNIIHYSIRSFFTNEYYSIIRFASKRLFVATLIVDELSDARTEATENEVTCEEMYSDCPSKSIMTLLHQFKNISKK